MENERWKPEKGDLYFFVSTVGNVFPDRADSDFARFNGRFGFGNYFRSRSEAEAAAEKIKELLLNLPDNGGNLPDNGNNLAPSLPDKQLPKLTAEVFDRPDCPDWAQYAAADADGYAFYYSEKPFMVANNGGWGIACNMNSQAKLIPEIMEATDWKNSLVERPAKLPEWCKVGEWIYTSNEQYLKIVGISIDLKCVEFSNGVKWDIQDVVDEAVPARLRPYNAKEMKALVGKVLETKRGSAILILQYIVGVNELCFWENRLNADMLLSEEYIIDGKPAGVLEHLEDGEWVE